MPRISAFHGIAIYMYWNEGDHPVPHFHAHQGSDRAALSVDGLLIAGHLESRALKFAQDWARLHRDERLSNRERARRSQALSQLTLCPRMR